MSDLFGNHIVGFPTRRLISKVVIPQSLSMIQEEHLIDGSEMHYENLPMQYTEMF